MILHTVEIKSNEPVYNKQARYSLKLWADVLALYIKNISIIHWHYTLQIITNFIDFFVVFGHHQRKFFVHQ